MGVNPDSLAEKLQMEKHNDTFSNLGIGMLLLNSTTCNQHDS